MVIQSGYNDQEYGRYVLDYDKLNNVNRGKGTDITTGDVYTVQEDESGELVLKYFDKNKKSRVLFGQDNGQDDDSGEVVNPPIEGDDNYDVRRVG